MKDWWNNLQSREQSYVMIAAVVVGLFIIYSMLWSPLTQARDTKRQQVENNKELLSWMVAKSAEVKQLKLLQDISVS